MQVPVRTTSQQNQHYSWPPHAATCTQEQSAEKANHASSVAVPSQYACQHPAHQNQQQAALCRGSALQEVAVATTCDPRGPGMHQLPFVQFTAGPLGPAAAAVPSMLSSSKAAAMIPIGSCEVPVPPPHSRAIVTTEISAPQSESATRPAISVQVPCVGRTLPDCGMAAYHVTATPLAHHHTFAPQADHDDPKAVPPARSLRSSRLVAAAGRPADGTFGGVNGVVPAITKAGIASRRFRARQKQLLTSLEADLADKLQQLDLLTAEHEMLQLKESVLSSVVAAGEEQVRLMQEAGPPVFGQDDLLLERARCNSITAAAVQVDMLSSSISVSSDESVPLLHWATSHASAAAVSMTLAQAPASQQHAVAAGIASGMQDWPQMLLQQRQLSVAQGVKCMSSDDILAIWRQFIKEVSYALARLQLEQATAAAGGSQAGAVAAAGPGLSQAGAAPFAGLPSASTCPAANKSASNSGEFDPCSPAAQRVRSLVQKYSTIVRLASQLNPGAYCGIFGRHVDSGMCVSCPDSHWQFVLQQMRLTADQVKQILACADLYQGQLSDVQQERTQLQQKLQESDVATDKLANNTGLKPGSHWLAGLSSNLKREHMLRVMLNCFIWESILTLLQGVKTCIHSHPFYPDWLAMVGVLRQTSQQSSSTFPPTFSVTTASFSNSSQDRTALQQKEDRWVEAANAFLGRQASAVFWGTAECDVGSGELHWLQDCRADKLRQASHVLA